MSSKESDGAVSKLFSPVRVSNSPKSSNKTANLTGNERQIKDGCADIYNAVQKWSKINREGTDVITEMANIRISFLLQSNEDYAERPDNSSDLQKLESLCEDLHSCVQKLKKLVLKMKAVANKFNGVQNLSQYKNDCDVMFQTWLTKDFASAAEEISVMYLKECELKQVIYENVCHAVSRDSVMFYTSAWVHQPYIEERAELLLQSMLTETGHVS
ncbi:cyclin-dependent kinase 2-interacting protein-like [Crassostrea angulata]|uniref:cyclin-dependent kinase 2-interacting protein-like n=1 Tax=Magallana angulata TaxID=2784310 RepID=UPI0022B1CF55|nr:cyclin-dependent kinase 2-interacting protein-like [Crassostrea angulata]